ncbi:hypothetical protein LEN26_017498 [Aphanomyces euteiches]|nr:hypothetical protein LEN26_017498 [Aphanomyces euteiches]KAH9123118.1 hypothetical protein AeMF1_005817 [Aphanomyces euteiches]KAH9179386.1 hypothetical protein AeNC1_017346 [Aphanomyces euteiches]
MQHVEDDDIVSAVLFSPDLGIVGGGVFGNVALNEPDDSDMWMSICNLLDQKSDDPSVEKDDGSTGAPKVKRKAKRVRVYTNKAEVQQLEVEIRQLQDELIQAKRRFESTTTDGSFLEIAAKQQRVEKNKALQENQQLQDAALPNVTPDESSRFIPADPTQSHAAIERTADCQYGRMQTMFIRAGAFDLRDDTCRGSLVSLACQEIGFLAMNHITIPAPYHVVARAVWCAMYGAQVPIPAEHEHESREQVNESTVYNKYCIDRDGATYRSNSVRKIYQEANRFAIVFATAFEDGNIDRHLSDVVEDINAWWQIAPHSTDPSSSYLTIVGQSNISRLINYQDVEIGEVESTLRRILTSIQTSGEEEAPSYLKPFIERRRRMRQSIQRAMEHAIREFKDRTKQSGMQD